MDAQALYPPGGPYYFTVRVENRAHPVTAGVEDFEIFDEQHTVKYSLDREHLLLRAMARDNLASEAGWWREAGSRCTMGCPRDSALWPGAR